MSTMNDHEIRNEIEAGKLIRDALMDGLAGACYELRMGNVYYDLNEGAKRFELKSEENVLIKPGHRVVLITKEELIVPDNILVRVVSKGSLFSIGLSPVATYADPGFSGNLGIVTENVSDKYIELPQGQAIAKAEFTRLSGPVARPYEGQHGFRTGIWPIKNHLQKTHAEVRRDKRVEKEREEALALLPAATRTIIRRVERTQFWVVFSLGVAIILNAAALVAIENKWIDTALAITTNLIATGIIGIGTLIATYIRKT